MVYTHDNFALVGLARGRLEDAGIEIMIKNEFAGTGFPPYNEGAQIWVLHDEDKEVAEKILSDVNKVEISGD
ncbi:MAG: DUF2007 domain-containing protein [Pseudohongiellaceae bacterium]